MRAGPIRRSIPLPPSLGRSGVCSSRRGELPWVSWRCESLRAPICRPRTHSGSRSKILIVQRLVCSPWRTALRRARLGPASHVRLGRESSLGQGIISSREKHRKDQPRHLGRAALADAPAERSRAAHLVAGAAPVGSQWSARRRRGEHGRARDRAGVDVPGRTRHRRRRGPETRTRRARRVDVHQNERDAAWPMSIRTSTARPWGVASSSAAGVEWSGTFTLNGRGPRLASRCPCEPSKRFSLYSLCLGSHRVLPHASHRR